MSCTVQYAVSYQVLEYLIVTVSNLNGRRVDKFPLNSYSLECVIDMSLFAGGVTTDDYSINR